MQSVKENINYASYYIRDNDCITNNANRSEQ